MIFRRVLLLPCALLLGALFAPGLPDSARGAESFTMRQAVEYALKANPGVEAKILMLEQARRNVGVAQSYFWPRVSLVGSANRLQNDTESSAYSSDEYSSPHQIPGACAPPFRFLPVLRI